MKETLGFQAEVNQLLHLVTHSLYSNKEIFLRELISNSSDAADKLRFEALSNDALYEGDSELKIWIDFDPKEHTITVRDNGIGMSREEAIANLGTIAKSGTKEFLASLTGDQSKDTNLIGQFGVGFYSSFVVADKVIVRTRRAGMPPEKGVLWESSGTGEYTVSDINVARHGTEVTLFLKPEDEEFLEYWRLKNVINKYSDHIILPIMMKKPVDESTAKDGDDAVDGDGDKGEAKEAASNKKSKKEAQWEVVNRATALWALPKKDIKDDEYKELYKHITHDFADPLFWIHNVVEGKLEYTTLLYVPEHAPFDLWHRDHKHGLKLYVQRVFIMDDAEQLLPNYLRFVRGIVDSKDLPLNVSREILQNNKVIEGIRSSVVKRVLDVLEKLAKDDVEKYAKFWKAFGQVIKEGTVEDFANKDKIAKLLRFNSTHLDSAEQNVSLDDYIARMQKEQDKIYYITADGYTSAKNSPHLEVFKKKGIEVLLLGDRVDEWMLSGFYEYEGKQLQSIAKGDIDLGKLENKAESEEEKKQKEEQEKKTKEEFDSMLKQMKEVLGDKVEEVRISHRLVDSPSCLVSGQFDMSLHLQRIMQAAGQSMPKAKQILEINSEHKLIEQIKTEADEQRFAEWTNLLFEQALLAGGGQLDDPAGFVKRVNTLLAGG